MDNGVDYDKLLELQFHGTIFLMHIRATSSLLSLQLQDKYNGDLWYGNFSSQDIQNITHKTGNYKKYSIFVKMLIASLQGATDSVCIDILTYHDLQMLKSRKNILNRQINTQQIQKRYLILNYLAQFDKIHYPLPLNYQQNPSIDRLKATIRRLSQQIKQQNYQHKTQSIYKQLSLLKHQNQLLKLKNQDNISNNNKSLMKQNDNNNNNDNLNNIIKQKNQQIYQLKNKLNIINKQYQNINIKYNQINQKYQQSEKQLNNKKKQLQKYINNNKDKNIIQINNKYKNIQQKFNQMAKQTIQLTNQLQYIRQQQKKDKMKINHLQKQLQKMMKQNNNNNNNYKKKQQTINSSAQKNSKSQKSQNNNKKIQQYKKIIKKKSSVYDSDTQSSRMRRLNNKISPFRQSSRQPIISTNSAKKTPRNSKNQVMVNRSKSKSVKKDSPPPSQESVLLSEVGYASDTDSQAKQINKTMAVLRGRKIKMNKNNQNQRIASNLQKKISSIAEMIRKTKINRA